jgi:hypothetical protein
MPADQEAIAAIKASLSVARELELAIEDHEQKLSQAKAELYALEHNILPSQFNTAGIRHLTLEAEGNVPSYQCELKPYFKAVIPAKWDEAKRTAAMQELEEFGAGDLAKRMVCVSFPRSESADCEHLCNLLDENGYSYSLSFDIPWQTLTAWLRETVESGQMPDLEKIGGQVGQVVKLKIVEE